MYEFKNMDEAFHHKGKNLLDAMVSMAAFTLCISEEAIGHEGTQKLAGPFLAKLMQTTKSIGEVYNIDIEENIEEIRKDRDFVMEQITKSLFEELFEDDPIIEESGKKETINKKDERSIQDSIEDLIKKKMEQ